MLSNVPAHTVHASKMSCSSFFRHACHISARHDAYPSPTPHARRPRPRAHAAHALSPAQAPNSLSHANPPTTLSACAAARCTFPRSRPNLKRPTPHVRVLHTCAPAPSARTGATGACLDRASLVREMALVPVTARAKRRVAAKRMVDLVVSVCWGGASGLGQADLKQVCRLRQGSFRSVSCGA